MNAERNVDKPATVLELKAQDRKFTYKEKIYPEGMTPPPAGSSAQTGQSPAAADTSSSPTTAPASSPGG